MADKKIRLLVQAEVNKAVNDLKRTENQTDKTTSAVKKLGAAFGVLASARVLGQVITSSVRTSAQFETLQTRLVALKGSVDEGRKSFDFFNKVAKTTPFQLANVVEAGAQLEAFGADSTETLKAVSDLAAFMGTDIVDAANAFGRAFAGGAGAADVLRERGVLTQVKLKSGFEDLSKLTLPQFREALINTLTDPEGNIAGATDLLSQTFSGLVSNFQDSLSQLQDSIGDLLAPTIKRIISVLKVGIDEITEGFRRLNETQLESTIRQLKDAGLETGNLEILNKEILLSQKQQITVGQTQASLNEKNKQAEQNIATLRQEIVDLQNQALTTSDNELTTVKKISETTGRIYSIQVKSKDVIEEQINQKIAGLALESQSITDNNELLRILKEIGVLEESIKLMKQDKNSSEKETIKSTEGILNIEQEISKSAQQQLADQIKQGKVSMDNAYKLFESLLAEIAILKLKNFLQDRINAKKEKELALTQATTAASSVGGGFFGFIRGLFQTGGSYVNRFQGGGSFDVNKRTILPTNPPAIVGDNASGMERIDITPLPAAPSSRDRGINIYISAPLVDETVVDHIIPAIRRAEKLGL